MKNKKPWLVWTLISLLFINYIGTHLMYGLYMVDKALFVELFCENKDHPEEECDGTCMLHKLGEHGDHSSTVLLDVFQTQLVFFVPDFQFVEIPYLEVEDISEFHYDLQYTFEIRKQKFRPPIILS